MAKKQGKAAKKTNMKHKKLIYRLVIVGLIIFAAAGILLITGFRLTSMQAARTSIGLNSTAQYVDDVDYKSGKVYLFKNADSYQAIATERVLFLWRSPASFRTSQNNDKVRLIGWCSLNNSNGGVTVIHVECFDKSVRYIEMGRIICESKKISLIISRSCFYGIPV